MLPLPQVAEPLLMGLGVAFTEPTFNRFLPLLVGAIVLRGRRTVTSILWTMRGLVPGHMTDYHRVFSRAAWVLWPLARVLATFAIALAEEHGGRAGLPWPATTPWPKPRAAWHAGSWPAGHAAGRKMAPPAGRLYAAYAAWSLTQWGRQVQCPRG